MSVFGRHESFPPQIPGADFQKMFCEDPDGRLETNREILCLLNYDIVISRLSSVIPRFSLCVAWYKEIAHKRCSSVKNQMNFLNYERSSGDTPSPRMIMISNTCGSKLEAEHDNSLKKWKAQIERGEATVVIGLPLMWHSVRGTLLRRHPINSVVSLVATETELTPQNK